MKGMISLYLIQLVCEVKETAKIKPKKWLEHQTLGVHGTASNWHDILFHVLIVHIVDRRKNAGHSEKSCLLPFKNCGLEIFSTPSVPK
jgi:hypothetical protein